MSDQNAICSGLLASLAGLPSAPSKFTKRYIDDVIARCDRRINVLQDRIGDIGARRVMPDRDDITIGSGRQFTLTVLFVDICGFSSRPNWLAEEHKMVLEDVTAIVES